MPDSTQLRNIECSLRSEFPWAENVINQIMSDLSARQRHGVLSLGMAASLLVGLPGSGKTRFCQRLSTLLGTPNLVINLAGMKDVLLLKGVTRGWASSRPSRIVELLMQTRVANPLLILDELDKTSPSTGNGGDPQAALLDLLEPANAKRYHDLFLLTECDVSHCLYIATANALNPVSEPLRSRLRLMHFPSPGPEHSAAILQGVLADIECSWRIPAGTLILTVREQAKLKGLAPRQMRHALLDILGAPDNRAFTRH